MVDQSPRFGLNNNYVQGEDNWNHDDTVDLLDELAEQRDVIANRPASGTYDNEVYFATDENVYYRWDAGTTSWVAIGGKGASGSPVPGTTFLKKLIAESSVHGENPAETITDSSTPKDLSFTGSTERDIHDKTEVTVSNGTTASVTEDVTVTLYDGVDNTGAQMASETQSVTVAAGASSTVAFITADEPLDTGDYFVEVTQPATPSLTVDSTAEYTKGATHTVSQSATGELEMVNQDGVIEQSVDPITGTTNLKALSTAKQSGTRYADQFNSIQAAIDDIPTASQDADLGPVALGEVYIPAKDPSYNETITADIQAAKIRGQGINTRITTTGATTLSITGDDCRIEDLWIDQDDSSGSYDAVYAGTEAKLMNIDIDAAPRYGLHADGLRVTTTQTQIQGGQTAGAYLSVNAERGIYDLITNNCPAKGLVVDGDVNLIRLNNTGSASDGATINGVGNVVFMQSFSSSGDDLVIDGDNNVVTIRTNGNVLLTANSANNKIVGYVGGTITDNGTANDTTDAI